MTIAGQFENTGKCSHGGLIAIKTESGNR